MLRPRLLEIAALCAFALAIALVAPLADRLIAAIWQWYKFRAADDDGHITSSLSTGLAYSALLAMVHTGRRLLQHNTAEPSSAITRFCSVGARTLCALAFVAYWLLGLSPLNVWRS